MKSMYKRVLGNLKMWRTSFRSEFERIEFENLLRVYAITVQIQFVERPVGPIVFINYVRSSFCIISFPASCSLPLYHRSDELQGIPRYDK